MRPLKHFNSWKCLKFKRPDCQNLIISVPSSVDQSTFPQIDLDDYLVFRVRTFHNIPQSSVIELNRENSIIGYLIPGQTIFSGIFPPRNKKIYYAYEFIIATQICIDSWGGDYKLCSPNFNSAKSISDVFENQIYYGVINLKKIDKEDFFDNGIYFNCLCSNDFFLESKNQKIPILSFTDGSKIDKLKLVKNKKIPDQVQMLFNELIFYEGNNILRFFYVYQVIEVIMGIFLDEKIDEIRNFISENNNLSKTLIRDKIQELGDATKEKSRINDIFNKEGGYSLDDLDRLLDILEIDCSKMSFADKIYKIRNLIFHDYTKMHSHESIIGEISNKLISIIFNKYKI